MSRPEYIHAGPCHIVVDGSRVWAFVFAIEAREVLEMTREQRINLPHVDLCLESIAQDFAWQAQFLEPAKKERLERNPGGWGGYSKWSR